MLMARKFFLFDPYQQPKLICSLSSEQKWINHTRIAASTGFLPISNYLLHLKALMAQLQLIINNQFESRYNFKRRRDLQCSCIILGPLQSIRLIRNRTTRLPPAVAPPYDPRWVCGPLSGPPNVIHSTLLTDNQRNMLISTFWALFLPKRSFCN